MKLNILNRNMEIKVIYYKKDSPNSEGTELKKSERDSLSEKESVKYDFPISRRFSECGSV